MSPPTRRGPGSDPRDLDKTAGVAGRCTETTAVAHWADRIRPHLAQALEGMVAAGRELLEAKAQLGHGEFTPLLAELGLSEHVAQRLMRVARHQVLSNPARVQALPAAIGTLDVLARLDEDDVEAALERGDITPSTTREEALTLVHGHDAGVDMNEVYAIAERLGQTVEEVHEDIKAYGWAVHPMLKLIPPMTPSERLGLIESIAEHGCFIPITVHDGVLLDGRERIRACRLLKIRPPVVGASQCQRDPIDAAIVISLNLMRSDYEILDDGRIVNWGFGGDEGRCSDGSTVYRSSTGAVTS